MTKRSSLVRKKDSGPETPILNSEGDALEHARLADEIQRLRKENEQRNAELAIINSVQGGLASKLDIQAIYNLVGDKIREIFPNTDLEIRIYDPKTNLIHFPYFIDNGERVAADSIPLTESGISSYILRTGQTLVINENFMQEAEKFGSIRILLEGGHLAKSAVFVPLIVNNQARGLLVLGNVEREHAFSDADVRLFETLANSMSTALENARLFDETKQRAAELAIINSVQEGLASKLDVQAIYDLVGNKIREVFKTESTLIALYDRKKNEIQFPYVIDETGKRFDQGPKPLSTGLSAHIIKTKVPLVINQDFEKLQAKLGARPFDPARPPKAYLGVPMLVGQDVVGVVALSNLEENTFNDSDVRLLTTIANSMSVALENARLFDETQRLLKETEQRNAELAIINSVQSALAARLDIQGIYDAVGDRLREIFDRADVGITIYDEKTNLIHIPYDYESGQRVMVDSFALDEQGFLAHVLRTREPLFINENMAQEMEKYGSHVIEGTVMDKSLVHVPLIAGDRARGIISIKDSQHEHAFNDSDVRLLTTIANSMSVALENARLFDETQRLLKETEQRNAELAVINSVQAGLAEGLASKQDMQAIYDLVGDKIRGLFPNIDTEIRIYDPQTNLFHVPYYIENGQRVAVDPISPSEATISAHVLRTAQTLVVNENIFQEMEKYGAKMMHGRRYPAKSMVFVPLLVGDQARGLIVLNHVEHEHAFSDSDVRLLQTLANSMSTALENARLFDETQSLLRETEQRNAELAIINSVQEGLSSKLDMQAIYDLVGDKIREIFHNTDTEIRVYDPKTNLFHVPYSIENGQRVAIEPISLSDARMSAHVLRTGQSLVINENFVQELDKYGAKMVLGRMHHPKSGVFVPLLVGDQARGLIVLSNVEREHAFNSSDVRLLQTLANSMSTALENARLFDEVQKKNAEITEALERETASNDILRVIAESPTDIQPVLEVIARNAAQLSGLNDAIITLREGDILRVDAHYGGIPTFPVGEGFRFSRDSVAGRAILEGRPLQAIHNQEGVKSEYPEGDKVAKKYGYRMSCAVPLMREGKAVGAISIRRIKPELLTEKQIALIQPFANQAAIAVENVRLFNELQKRNTEITEALEQQTAMSEILSIIAENPTDVQPVLNAVAERAAKLCNSYDGAIARVDGDTYRVVAHWGPIPISRWDAVPLNRHTVTGRAMVDRKIIHVHDLLAEPPGEFELSKEFYQISKRRTFLVTPLMRENQVIGSIMIRRQEVNPFTDKQVALLKIFADQAAIAIENVRLFNETTRLLKETEQRAAELAIINSVQEGLASKLDMQAIYDLVGDKISEIFDAPAVFISTYDLAANRAYYPYYSVERKRISLEPQPPSGAALEMIRTRRPFFLPHNAEKRLVEEYKMPTIPGTPDAESYLLMPMIVGSNVRGGIGVMSTDRQHPLNDSSVRLLQTIASSMSVALENARLFDETQRLLKETEQRAAELAIINSVQEGLASKLDMQAIYDLVGDEIRDLFHPHHLWILTFDPAARVRRVRYSFEKGQRYYVQESFPYNKLTEYLIVTKKPLVINQNFTEAIARFEMADIIGTLEDAKSVVYIPILAGEEVKGFISLQNIERENAFSESDVNLLSTFASSMSITLENIRLFDETQRLLKETEQRAAELAIINSIQEGLASKLDMQAIYDLVGDKIRDLFNTQAILIVTLDPVNRTREIKYFCETGQRYYTSELFPYNQLTEYLIATKKTLVINEDAEAQIAEFEMVVISKPFKAAVFVPLITGGEVKGFISIQNLEQENAFSDSDVNLLSTFAASMSVALENASLFDETQRLLKETEQRAAELAIINNVQQGLASKLEMQAIYEMVGDEMQEIFSAQSLLIVTFDHSTEMVHVTYNREKGIRYYSEPYPFTGLNRYLIQSGRTLVINENLPEWQAKLDMVLLPGTEIPKSTVFVPLTSGKKVSGFISLQNLEHENAFSEMDVRLLETLASSMSVALENASLFDETQRLFLEAKEARMAAEQANQAKSAFLSSMSHELRTPLNAIINFVEIVARGMMGPVNQEQVELLDQTLDSSKHLLNLINDVLDISKIQAGQLTLFIEDQVSVQVEVEAALNIAGGLLQEKGLQLIRDIDPHLPLVSCDRRRLRQVLLNLISNAIKFTSEGTVTVSVKNQGQEVLFGVIDTGPGIPRDKQGLIFEPFLQTENGERQMQGTGLGLPISRSLVRAHGGELWVDSQPGEGSAFFFTLPVERSGTS